MHTLRTALVITALFAAAPATAMAQATTRFERGVEEYFDQLEHPCNGELVTLTGTLTVTSHRTVDPNGMVHFSATGVPHIRGEGASGGEYIVRDAFHLKDQYPEGGDFPGVSTLTFDFSVVGKGKAPNFHVAVRVHRVFDAAGTSKVEFEREAARCTG